MNGKIAVGSFSVLVFLTQRFLWPFTSLGQIVDSFERSMASTSRILSLLDINKSIIENKNPKKILNRRPDITFKNINFGYSNEKLIFKNFSLSIPYGKTIGIVGHTGSGKTTIIKLLLRLYDVKSGDIYIGDQKIEEISLTSLRKNIGFVNQEIHLFDGSIRENIAYPNIPNSINKINKAAKISQSYEFISQMNKGLDTQIGERGQKLSVGQKQRLTIARALYKDPSILVFDEATSSVDNETERLIQRAFEEISKNRTTIIIAHRLSTVRNADKIIVLEKGQIIESGTHEELIRIDSFYNQLWQIQTGDNE